MQALIWLAFISPTFAAGDFSNKVNFHAKAVAATQWQITRVGEAQLKFKELVQTCAPKNILNQESLLSCGSKYLQLSLELQKLKTTQDSALKAVVEMPPEFAAAAASLNKTLAESAKIISEVTEIPEKLSNSFFAMNSVYVQKQFERTSHDSFSQARVSQYCNSLQSEMDALTQLSALALNSKLPFPSLYKQQVRLQNTLALAEAITPVCHKSYEVTRVKVALGRLNAQLTSNSFLQYKKSICQRPVSSAGLSPFACQRLPLAPYAIRWLEAAGGGK
ncbi:MAG: hypothetical protein ACXWRE_09120 [Pseudobdellovibrionaceae bacterium]